MIFNIILVVLLIAIVEELNKIRKALESINDPYGWLSKIYRQNKEQGKEVPSLQPEDWENNVGGILKIR